MSGLQNNQSFDDEIDLIEYVTFLWSKKLFIFIFTTIFSLSSVAYVLSVTPEYEVTAVVEEISSDATSAMPNITGGLGAAASLLGVNVGGASNSKLYYLNSRVLTEEFIIQNNLLDIIQENPNAEGMDDSLSLYGAVTGFQGSILSVAQGIETGLITIAFRWTDPAVAVNWLDSFIDLANENLRRIDQELAENKYDYLMSELNNTSSIELRQSLASLIETQMQIITLANVTPEYAFRMVDPPRIPNIRVYPRRTLTVILTVIASGFLAVLFLLIRRFFFIVKSS